MRVGLGFDLHRMVAGRKLILCGVEIPSELGLLGHSDADVALHALTDALLGAAGLPDIGILFPDDDPRYQGADSALFLQTALELCRQKGYNLHQADLILILDYPKIAPHREKLRDNLARLLRLPPERVGLKAKSTEGLASEKFVAAIAQVLLLEDGS